ncbi:MAG: tetratricopeptide repeat protein [Lachnospiraceae bacterium]|nr:tetratricopeptide repeat protein [Lachnospiraceae bacterium]
MDKQKVWQVLDMEPTKDEKLIKARYRQLLPLHNPEDDAEGFKELREAFDEAIRLINAPDEKEEENRPDDAIEHWLDRIREIYPYPEKRIDEELWKDILADDVCVGLDSFEEARERLLVFLMDHHYLPHTVWALIDQCFSVREDKKDLLEKFPSNYLQYVFYQIETETFGDYSIFEKKEGFNEESLDKYLILYFELFGIYSRTSGEIEIINSRDDLDEERKKEGTDKLKEELRKLPDRIPELAECGLWHPYEDLLKLRIKLTLKDASGDTEELLNRYPNEMLILKICGEYLALQGRWEEARDCWDRILKKEPGNQAAIMDMATYLHHIGEYDAAENMIRDNIGGAGGGPHLRNFFIKLQEDKHEALMKKLAADPDNDDTYIEACWSLFHSNQFDETLAMLEKREFKKGTSEYYDYVDMLGRIYLEKQDYDKSYRYLKEWEYELEHLPDDGSEKYGKRKKTLGYQKFVIGQCCFELGKIKTDKSWYKVSEDYLKDAISAEEDPSMHFIYKDQLMQLYLRAGRYEECVDMCDNMLEDDENYIPAYLRRQEAYYHLGNEQGIVDDYHYIIGEVKNYYRTYLLAARVLIDHAQWDNAENVLKTAKENLVSHPTLDIQELRILRGKYDDQQHMDEAIEKCNKLIAYFKDNPEPPYADDEDKLTIDDAWYQLYCVYAEHNDFKTALKLINARIKEGCKHLPTNMLRANILRMDKRNHEAIKAYKTVLELGADACDVNYYLMLCYRALNDHKKFIESFEAAIKAAPEAEKPRFELALYYKVLYKNEEQVECFEKSVEQLTKLIEMSGHPRYFAERAYMYKLRARYEDAIADLEEALRRDPECRYFYDSSWYDLGDLYFLTHNTEKSMECFAKSRELFDEAHYGALMQPADVYGSRGEWAKALEWLSAYADRLMEQPFFAKKYADFHLSCGHPEKAGEIYDRLYKEKKIDSIEYHRLILNEIMISAPQDFDQVFKQTWKAIGKDAHVHDYGAYFLTILRGYVSSDKKTIQAVRTYIDMGCELLFARQLDKCISYLKKAGALHAILGESGYLQEPDTWVYNEIEINRHLAMACKLAGKDGAAAKYAKRCLKVLLQKKPAIRKVAEFSYGKRDEVYYVHSFEGKNPYRYKLLASLYLCMGEKDKAMALLDKAESSPLCIDCQHQQCYDALIIRGYAAEIEGNKEEALKYFRKALSICPSDRENSMGEYVNRKKDQ